MLTDFYEEKRKSVTFNDHVKIEEDRKSAISAVSKNSLDHSFGLNSSTDMRRRISSDKSADYLSPDSISNSRTPVISRSNRSSTSYHSRPSILMSHREAALANELLYKMMPKNIADNLKHKAPVKPQQYDEVTVFFSDIVSFTRLSNESTPEQILEMLDDLYTIFDTILDNYDAYKVETVGDAYMVASGCPNYTDLHAEVIADFSLELVDTVEKKFIIRHKPEQKLKIRVGIHSGPIVAGVVGSKMPRYCLFGDTVNTASRMESNSEAMKIHCSDTTSKILRDSKRFILEERGNIDVRNRGPMKTCWLIGQKTESAENSPLPEKKGGALRRNSSVIFFNNKNSQARRPSRIVQPTHAMRRASRLININPEDTAELSMFQEETRRASILMSTNTNAGIANLGKPNLGLERIVSIAKQDSFELTPAVTVPAAVIEALEGKVDLSSGSGPKSTELTFRKRSIETQPAKTGSTVVAATIIE